MAQFTANTLQNVNTNQNVLFTDVPVKGNCLIIYREGSGLVTVNGTNNSSCKARYRVFFSGNISVPDGGTAGPISMAIALNGEPIASTIMTATPTSTESFFNVATSTILEIPCKCCYQISVYNTTNQTLAVQNASLIIEKAV